MGALSALPIIGLPACSRSPQPTQQGSALASGFFEGLGFGRIEPLPLVTSDAFNGGVRYDDTRPDYGRGKTLVEQPCCRVEDLRRSDDPAVLALFTICAIRDSAPRYRGEVLEQGLDFLVNGANLDPARLVLVTTDEFAGLEHIAEQHGIGGQQIVTRDREEALAAADGSGYFAPADHPLEPAYWTAGIYYAPEPQDFGSELNYPMDGFLEIGEYVLANSDESGDRSELLALGVERLAMARGDGRFSFEESVAAAISMIDDEASAHQVKRPTAYTTLTQLS